MNRENFIRIIPKPTNEEVILYDISLKDLIDVNVIEEYYKLLPIFREAKSEFLKLKEEVNTYKDTIHQLFLFNPSWSEEKYLEELQENMRKYSILYGDIKKKEDELKILQKKIEAINDKIIIQKNKEERELQERKDSLNNEIEENKMDLNKYKDNMDVYKKSLKKIDEQIKNIKEDLKMLNLSERQLNLGIYKCFCCGKEIEANESEYITNNIKNNIIKYKENLKMLSEEKEKIKNTIKYYKDESSRIKIKLKNNLSFKRNCKKMYMKKSIEILKLEASQNECLEKMTQLKENLKNEDSFNSKKFLELKNTIEKYKISLENLKKIKTIKATMAGKLKTYNRKQEQLDEMTKLITKYLSFLNIYYKIYEKKASEYAGPDYKIKLFEIKNLEIIEILNIKYKNVEYVELTKKNKEIVDKNLLEKFSLNY